eukprot:2840199-Amphidinium_carterae.1
MQKSGDLGDAILAPSPACCITLEFESISYFPVPKVLTAGVTLVSPEQEPATRFSLVPGCALHDGLATWNTLPAGAVLILPVTASIQLRQKLLQAISQLF